MVAMVIFTIGHSRSAIEHIIQLLKQHGIETLVDVRSAPYSRYNPQFNREIFQSNIQRAGLEYRFMGDSLGGRPQDPSCYQHGEVIYDLIRSKPWYQRGLEDLLSLARTQQVAIMCSEEDPLKCHRNLLIAQSLLELEQQVKHIRGSGDLEDAAPPEERPQQLTLL